MSEQFKIPKELKHSLFFSENDTMSWDGGHLNEANFQVPFLYEAAYYSNVDALKPWENAEQFIPLLKIEWQEEKQILEEIFAKREAKKALAPMKKGIGLFLQFVYWANGLPVNLEKKLSDENLRIKPVNIDERLGFIIQRPILFHSYKQLNELMLEMEKQYVKYMEIKKASKQK